MCRGCPSPVSHAASPASGFMESSRHSVHCLSTTFHLSNLTEYMPSKNNTKHHLDSKNPAFCASWHNSPPILWLLRKHPNHQTRWSTWIASLAVSGKLSFELMPTGNGD
jgi:hypothetical protein